MDEAKDFHDLFRLTYIKSARRKRDKRDGLSNESHSILSHMASLGPASLSELARHFSRAPSTLTEIFKNLESKGLLERQTDLGDKRKVIFWLSDKGFDMLALEDSVLDESKIKNALLAMDEKSRSNFLILFQKFTDKL